MRVLHLVKTSDGAQWAAWQAGVLGTLGVEVHVALPCPSGRAVALWQRSGATIHIADASLPVRRPWRWGTVRNTLQGLVDSVKPDLIHSHFVTTTLAARLALGKRHGVSRLFQVPGPLHLEHGPYRKMDLQTAGPDDFWIASSRYIHRLYSAAGVPANRLFLSYYGFASIEECLQAPRLGRLREQLNISPDQKVVGNINFMYPPKYFLGQTAGLKRHEDVIDALALVCERRKDVVGVLIGGQSSGGEWYRHRLCDRARRAAGDRIILVGQMEGQQVPRVSPRSPAASAASPRS